MIINEVDTDDLVNFKYVVDLIKEQIQTVLELDPEYYSQFIFDVVNEQYFVPDDEREPNRIFIVIKFSPAEVDYGQDIMPLTIQAISECNGLVAVQRLLLEYAQIFNLHILRRDGKTIYQNYTTPNVISNFDVIYEGFRSVLIMSGTFLLSSNINRITLKYYNADYALLTFPEYTATSLPQSKLDYDYIYYNEKIYKWNTLSSAYVEWDFEDRLQAYIGENDRLVDIDTFETPDEKYIYSWKKVSDEDDLLEEYEYVLDDGEEIDILNFTDNFDASPNTQPYFNNKNFTDSIIKYGTYSFNVSSFLIRNDLNNKVLKLISRKKTVNTNFYFKIFMDNELNMPLLRFKLINCVKQQNKGEMPSIVLAFTN